MGRSSIGLVALVSVLTAGVLGGYASKITAPPNREHSALEYWQPGQATIFFRPSGKGLRKDVEGAIKEYWNTCGVSDNPEEGYGCAKRRKPDTLYLHQCVDDALKGLRRWGTGFCIIYAPDPNYTTGQ